MLKKLKTLDPTVATCWKEKTPIITAILETRDKLNEIIDLINAAEVKTDEPKTKTKERTKK